MNIRHFFFNGGACVCDSPGSAMAAATCSCPSRRGPAAASPGSKSSLERKGKLGGYPQLCPFTSYNYYNWLFLWDYTFQTWGYKYLQLVKGHNCMVVGIYLKQQH